MAVLQFPANEAEFHAPLAEVAGRLRRGEYVTVIVLCQRADGSIERVSLQTPAVEAAPIRAAR
jgi:hypothetical protein